MINNEWERSLDELNRTIQDAIDHQNYGRLNQNVTDTIGRAMEGLSRGLRNGIRYGSDAMNAAADNFAQRQRQAGNTPPFHNQGTGSAGGLWDQYPVEQVATPEGYAANPKLVIDFYNERRKQLLAVKPNRGHELVSEMEY